MYSTKLLSNLTFLIGIIIILIGIWMSISNINSEGMPYKTRLGTNVNSETINGFGTIILGILLVLVSSVLSFKYKKEKSDRINKK